jgi:uncharacterized membrane protein
MQHDATAPRRRRAGRGTDWLMQGWRLFAFSPGLWIVFIVVLFLLFIALAMVPLIGALVAQIVQPAIAGGVLLTARDAAAGRALDLGRLFEPLTRAGTRGDVVILGLLYFGGTLAVVVLGGIVMLLVVGGALLQGGAFTDPAAIDSAALASSGLLGAMLGVLIVLALGLAVAALFFYAIPLLVLGGASPIDALGRGTRGLLINWRPLLVLGLVWTPLAIVATIPLMLGWLILGPVTFGAWYASYRDIFEPPSAAPDDTGPAPGLVHEPVDAPG